MRSSVHIAGNAKGSGATSGEGEVKIDIGGEEDGETPGECEAGNAILERNRVRRELQCAACANIRTHASGTICPVNTVSPIDVQDARKLLTAVENWCGGSGPIQVNARGLYDRSC